MLLPVILESPFAANPDASVETHVEYARRCVRDSLLRAEAPLASHLLYTQPDILDDAITYERDLGIRAGHVWTEYAVRVVVYEDYGRSRGMNAGIKRANETGTPIEYRRIGKNPVKTAEAATEGGFNGE